MFRAAAPDMYLATVQGVHRFAADPHPVAATTTRRLYPRGQVRPHVGHGDR